jgi:hypothetical protein
VYPEVRQKWIDLLREQVRYGADGISFVFARGAPFVGYDKPAVDRFKEQYGLDPVTLDEYDERWLRFSASYVTQFLREIRQMLDEEAKRQGRSTRLGTAYHAVRSPEESLKVGLDVKVWIDERLVDYLVVHPAQTSRIVEAFAPLTRGTQCLLYADVYPRNMATEVWLQKAITMYDAGADGLALWDTDARPVRISEWAMARKLGHRDELKSWKVEPHRYFRVIPLKSLGGRVIDKYYQTNG